jgi:hypothetical protein
VDQENRELEEAAAKVIVARDIAHYEADRDTARATKEAAARAR